MRKFSKAKVYAYTGETDRGEFTWMDLIDGRIVDEDSVEKDERFDGFDIYHVVPKEGDDAIHSLLQVIEPWMVEVTSKRVVNSEKMMNDPELGISLDEKVENAEMFSAIDGLEVDENDFIDTLCGRVYLIDTPTKSGETFIGYYHEDWLETREVGE